jgi:hypothetical protein
MLNRLRMDRVIERWRVGEVAGKLFVEGWDELENASVAIKAR